MKPNHETIYLVPTDYDGGQLTYSWCDCPAPGEGMDPEDAIKYVRADLVPASNEVLARRVVELTNERDTALAQLVEVQDNRTGKAPCERFCEALATKKMFDNLQSDNRQLKAQVYRIRNIIENERDIIPKLYDVLNSIPARHPDDKAVDRFAAAMKTKLAAARAKGRSGWDDKASCSGEHLAQLLVEHLSKGNLGTFEDIANFAMMLHQRGESPQLMAQCFAEHNVGVIDSFDAFIEMTFPQEGVNFDTYLAALDMFREQLRQQAKAGA